MSTVDRTRHSTTAGLLAPAVTLTALFVATIVAAPETFTWRERALSDMGRYGAETFWLFNGGLVVGGLLGLAFAWVLWAESETRVERIGVSLFVIAGVGLVGVGVFFLGHTDHYLSTDLHGPAALVFFSAAPLAQWCYGTGLVLNGTEAGVRVGLASIWLGIVHPLAWLGWVVSRLGASETMAWFAVPEAVAAVAFGSWVLLVAVWHRRGRP